MTICGTGHRPDKLGGYSQNVVAKLILIAHQYLRNAKPTKVVSGMALGWDQALAIAAIQLNIPLIAAVPFKGQELVWPEPSKIVYNGILEKCEEVITVSGGVYSSKKMQIRNEFMVDMSDVVLALWNGSAGGTMNCLKYAAEQEKPIVNLYEKFKEGVEHGS